MTSAQLINLRHLLRWRDALALVAMLNIAIWLTSRQTKDVIATIKRSISFIKSATSSIRENTRSARQGNRK